MAGGKVKKYSTSYRVNNNTYGSYIYAKSLSDAEMLAEKRNIGETVYGVAGIVKDGYGRTVPEDLINPDFRDLNDYEFLHNLPAVIHSACFMGFIAASSGVFTVAELLGDEGVVHELVHLMNGSRLSTRNIRRARGKFMELQNKVTGLSNGL